MGIANTTPSAALVAAFTGCGPGSRVTGRGTGVDDPTLARKVGGHRGGAARPAGHRRPGGDARLVGGFEHAGIAGFLLGAAARRVPVVLDGVIAGAAALVAAALAPDGGRATASPATAASSPATGRPGPARPAPGDGPRPAAGRGHRGGAGLPDRGVRRAPCSGRWRPSTPPGWPARTGGGARERLPAVPLRAAAARAAGCSSSAAATSRSAGSRGCSPPAPTSSWSPR